MTTAPAENAIKVHFYLRSTRTDEIRGSSTRYSKHRFGCIAIEKTATGYEVAYSIASPADRFSARIARSIAFGRLDVGKTTFIPSLPNHTKDLFTWLNIASDVKKHTKRSRGIMFDVDATQDAYQGAIKNFTPKPSAEELAQRRGEQPFHVTMNVIDLFKAHTENPGQSAAQIMQSHGEIHR